MHKVPNFLSNGSIFSKFSQRKHFFCLKLIKIFIEMWSFFDLPLLILLIIMVIVFKVLPFFIIVIVEIPHSMSVFAFVTIVDAESSEIESA